LQPLIALLGRDLRLAWRRSGETLSSLAFLLVALSLFPLGVGAAPEVLARIGSGVLWVLALFAVLLGVERLWQSDAEDGSLELMLLSRLPLELLVLARALAFWLAHGLPLVLISPLLVLLLAMPAEAATLVPVALLLGTPTLVLLGQIGAALLIGARRGTVLLSLIVLPLYVPVLIFGVGAIENGVMGLGSGPYLLILGAMLLAAAAFTPLAAAAALRLALH
jgi:heme exporter protein B